MLTLLLIILVRCWSALYQLIPTAEVGGIISSGGIGLVVLVLLILLLLGRI